MARPPHIKMRCPKCDRLTLCYRRYYNDSRVPYNGYNALVCMYNFVSPRAKRQLERGSLDQTPRRKEQLQKKLANACGCVIQHPDRDAEVGDYNVLETLSKNDSYILYWLKGNRPDVRPASLVVLHETDFCVVARRTDRQGPGISIYFKPALETSPPMIPAFQELIGPSSRDILFKGISINNIVSSYEFVLWRKRDETTPFAGQRYNSHLTNAAVAWAVEFEAAWPQLLEKAKSEKERWRLESEQLQKDVGPRFCIETFDANTHTCSIRAYNLSFDEARQAAKTI